MKKLLEQCGKVSQWRRVADPVSGKLKGFGFCDYETPEGVLRALRLLSSFTVASSELLLKVDEKTKKYLDDYSAKKRAHLLKLQQVEAVETDEKKVDEAVKEILKQLVRKRDKGEDYRIIDIDSIRAGQQKILEESKVTDIEKEKENQLLREAKEKQTPADKMDVEKTDKKEEDEEEKEKEKRIRLERERYFFF